MLPRLPAFVRLILDAAQPTRPLERKSMGNPYGVHCGTLPGKLYSCCLQVLEMCVGLRLRTPFCVVLLLGLWWILAELSLLSHKSASAAAPTPASPSLAAAPRRAARANAASLETAREKRRARSRPATS